MLLFALWKNEEERSDVGKEKKRVRGVEQGWGEVGANSTHRNW